MRKKSQITIYSFITQANSQRKSVSLKYDILYLLQQLKMTLVTAIYNYADRIEAIPRNNLVSASFLSDSKSCVLHSTKFIFLLNIIATEGFKRFVLSKIFLGMNI